MILVITWLEICWYFIPWEQRRVAVFYITLHLVKYLNEWKPLLLLVNIVAPARSRFEHEKISYQLHRIHWSFGMVTEDEYMYACTLVNT